MFIIVFVAFHVVLLNQLTDGLPNGNGSRVLWTPADGRTREEWLACNGLPADSCRRMPDKMRSLAQLLYGKAYKPTPQNNDTVSTRNTTDDCILLTEEQVDQLIQRVRHEKSANNVHGRRKRKVVDFETDPYSKWRLPIVFKFDGTHDSTEQQIVRNAIQFWERNTCLRFHEIYAGASYTDNHIMFVKPNSGKCSSYVGRAEIIPQPINLGEGCLSRFGIPGTPVHEIGHAVGLFHEHQRTDRDGYVWVMQDNIVPESYAVNYAMVFWPTLNVVPYNFGSVMHYRDGAFAKSSDLHTLGAFEPLYQYNMGQQSELSVGDAKTVNIAYDCDSAMCSSRPALNCQRGGYRDPNNCGRCKCPDGFGGNFCERAADPVNALCGFTRVLGATEQVTIKSDGYDNPGYYDEMQECSWLIKSSDNLALRLQFVGAFGIMYPTDKRNCPWHWIEVKYKSDLGLEGARFCGLTAPEGYVTSEWSEMMIVFKTNFDSSYQYRGFQAVITTGNPVTTTTTTTTTTTITTTPTTATTSTTTDIGHTSSVQSTIRSISAATHQLISGCLLLSLALLNAAIQFRY